MVPSYFLLLFVILGGCGCTLLLGDIQYAVPRCDMAGIGLRNSYASLLIGNDLMGERLSFSVAMPQQFFSCRLCEISPSYCTTPNNSTKSGLRLATDTQYNFKVITLPSNNGTPTSTGYSLVGGGGGTTPTISIQRDGMCGNTHQMVIQVIISIDRPIERDFWLVAYQLEHPQSIPCITGGLSDLSCRTAGTYYFVQYDMKNCLSMGEAVAADFPTTHFTPMYYYYEAVVMGNVGILGDSSATLCGETWLSIYERARLHEYCNFYNPLYVKPKAWYEAALLITSAWLNGNRGVDVFVGLEALESTCSRREAEVLYEETIFTNITQWLEEEDPTYDKVAVCEWINMAGLNTQQSNITLPFFATHNVREGFLALFLYLVEPNDEMPIYASLLFTLPFFIVFLSLVIFVATLYHIYCRPPANEYALI
jgi:hypothetical protein